jgi:hypothetical protein
MLYQEINEELLKLAKFYEGASVVLSQYQNLGDEMKPVLQSVITVQNQLVEKLRKAALEEDFFFNISFYGDELSSLYKRVLGVKGPYNELHQDVNSYLHIHNAQCDQLVTIHELMSTSAGFNN